MEILNPVTTSITAVGGYLPKLIVLLVILVVGSLAAVGIAALVAWFLKVIKLEKGAKIVKIPEILKKGGIGLSLSGLIAEIVFFLIVIVTLITALKYYGLGAGVLTTQILSYLPQVVAAIFVLVLGILMAIFISGVISLAGGNMKIAQSDTLANIAKYAVIIVAALAALRELGLGIIVTDKSKDIIFGGLVLSLALAFGLGAKDKAGKFLDSVFKK